MKKLLLLFVMLNLFQHLLYAQGGSILSFYTLPASPTTNDAVKVVAELMFTSGDCQLAEQGHSTTANRTDAYAHHCVGMLTVICPTTDTFELGILPAGNHVFTLTLTSGAAPAPCTPGIVTDDIDSLTFTVDPGVGIHTPDAVDFSVYPNPASTQVSIESTVHSSQSIVAIYSAQGQLVQQLSIGNYQLSIDVSQYSPGLYYLHLQSAEGVGVKRFEVIR